MARCLFDSSGYDVVICVSIVVSDDKIILKINENFLVKTNEKALKRKGKNRQKNAKWDQETSARS